MRPRIRSIKPELWADEKIGSLSREARLCQLVLVTMADDEGRFRARRSEIIGHGYPDDDDAPALVDGWIAEIKESGAVLFYLVDGKPYGAFRNWAKHQVINRPTPSDLPPPPSPKVVRENGLVRIDDKWKQTARLPDSSLNTHGGITEDSMSPQSPRGSDPDPAVVRLNERLGRGIAANDPKFDLRKISSARWQTDMGRLLHDRDGDEAEISTVIDYATTDPFERANILSPGKLRARFTALKLKAERPTGAAPSQNVIQIDEKAARTARRLAAAQRVHDQQTGATA